VQTVFMNRQFVAAALLLGLLGAGQPTKAQQPGTSAMAPAAVHLVRIDGAIGVGTEARIQRALAAAEAQSARLLILEIDTPGGLVASTRKIIKMMLASSVPVAVFVAPSGARAASAGTYIAYAAHIVAMAPGTHLGAATPIQMTPPGLPGSSPNRDSKEDDKPVNNASAANKKMVNDAIAYLRTLAELRGRSTEWAEKFVRDAATLTAAEAKEEGVIDFMAKDIDTFLARAHGRNVTTQDGTRTLDVRGAAMKVIEPGWKEKFLTAITDPNIAFILLLIGVYGIFFEFWSPGLTGPGVIGAISLILGLYALSVLPISYAGLALLCLGIVLMVGEALAPGIGILGIGGVIAFIVGAIFLFDPAGSDIDFAIYQPLIIVAAATTAMLILGLLGYLIRSRRERVATGSEQLIGLEAKVVSWSDGKGRVHVHGEIWQACSREAHEPGEIVRVVGREGLTLQVAAVRETAIQNGAIT
jgi:membrane-bound serine protease (ClpP class)